MDGDLADPRRVCEEFARLKGYRLELVKVPWKDRWFVRMRYGKYCLKYFDGWESSTRDGAYDNLARMLCTPDLFFNPYNFKGWSHFGTCSGLAELAMRMAIYGDSGYFDKN